MVRRSDALVQVNPFSLRLITPKPIRQRKSIVADRGEPVAMRCLLTLHRCGEIGKRDLAGGQQIRVFDRSLLE
jgi:hypothetical protein